MSASTELHYVIGDATRPEARGPKIIAHVCNDVGGWGRGFVVALSRRWPEPENAYRAWYSSKSHEQPFALGEVQFVSVSSDTWVANMIGQRDIRPHKGVPPVRYEAIRTALSKVAAFAASKGASVHMPRIGSGLAGGDWAQVAAIVKDELLDKSIATYVYDLPTG